MKMFLFLLLTFCCCSISAQQLNKKLFDSIDDKITAAYLLNDQSEYGKSVVLSNKLLDFLEVHPDTLLLTRLYGTLSYSYAELKDKEKAFMYAYKAIELKSASRDSSSIIIGYNDLGVTYQDFNMNDKARESYLEAARIGALYGSDIDNIFPMINIGFLLIDVDKKYAEAEPYLLKALEYSKKAELQEKDRTYVEIYNSLGIVYYKLNQFKKSEDYFAKAFKISTEENYFDALLDYYNERAMLYREDGKYKESLSMLEKILVIRDSIDRRKELQLVKKIEIEHKIKESEAKLAIVEKENTINELLFQKSKKHNWILIALTMLLLITVYWAFRNNSKLKIAKNKAERLTNVKSAFYSEISHELRTPLYAVIELSSLLLKENVTQTHKEYLESLNFSAGHLIALVNNVLELNKVEYGTLKVQYLNVNLESLFSNIISSLEYGLLHSNNTISLSYDKEIPEKLTGDSLKLSQVMINLISNAIKFTRNGHINIIVKKIAETKEGINLYFEVSDNGSGISVENQEKIFEAYHQEAYDPDHRFKGTGLGLSIVHRLLNVMGTQINIESEIDKGSKFFFELPLGYLKEVNTVAQKQELVADKIKGLHFLIVDDNKINQLVTRKLIESLGMTFEIVDSGFRAIEIIKNKKFDGILMDLHMPEMDGYQAAKQIREFNSTIPIIALTAANSDEVEERIRNSAIDACVFKPFFTSDLVEAISHMLN